MKPRGRSQDTEVASAVDSATSTDYGQISPSGIAQPMGPNNTEFPESAMSLSPVRMPLASLEQWMREFYFAADVDIGSSGVEPYSFQQIRAITNIQIEDLDRLSFCDSVSAGAPGLRQAIADRW